MRLRIALLSLLLVACDARGCGPDLSPIAEAAFAEDCTPAHGVCYGLLCPADRHPDDAKYCGVLAVCCMPGAPPPPPAPSDSASPPGPPPPGMTPTCDGVACTAGCACRPVYSDLAGRCEGTCDCGPPDDAGADASDLDAGDDADAAPATDRACGSITCSSKCSCESISLSVCVCFSDSCQ